MANPRILASKTYKNYEDKKYDIELILRLVGVRY